VQGSW